jgi:hypothetical protein
MVGWWGRNGRMAEMATYILFTVHTDTDDNNDDDDDVDDDDTLSFNRVGLDSLFWGCDRGKNGVSTSCVTAGHPPFSPHFPLPHYLGRIWGENRIFTPNSPL